MEIISVYPLIFFLLSISFSSSYRTKIQDVYLTESDNFYLKVKVRGAETLQFRSLPDHSVLTTIHLSLISSSNRSLYIRKNNINKSHPLSKDLEVGYNGRFVWVKISIKKLTYKKITGITSHGEMYIFIFHGKQNTRNRLQLYYRNLPLNSLYLQVPTAAPYIMKKQKDFLTCSACYSLRISKPTWIYHGLPLYSETVTEQTTETGQKCINATLNLSLFRFQNSIHIYCKATFLDKTIRQGVLLTNKKEMAQSLLKPNILQLTKRTKHYMKFLLGILILELFLMTISLVLCLRIFSN